MPGWVCGGEQNRKFPFHVKFVKEAALVMVSALRTSSRCDVWESY